MNKKCFLYSLPMILLIIVVVAGWFATDYLGNKARQEIIKDSQNDASTLSIHISDTLNNIEGIVKSLSGAAHIAPALLSKSDQDIKRANSTLDRYNAATNASVTYLMDANGMTVASSNRKDPDSFWGISYRFRPYFREAAKGKPYHYFALGITSGKRGFYASYPVQNRLGKVIGVVTMKKDIDDMEIFFRKYPFCFFINPDGIIFLSSKPEMVLKSLWPLDKTKQQKLIASQQFGSKLSEAVTPKEIADGTEVTLEGKDYFVSRKVIGHYGWSTVVLTPTDRIRIYKLTGILVTISVSILIIVFSGVIYLTDRSRNAIRQSEVFLSNIFDNSPFAQWISDERGTLIKQNQACRELFHITDEEIVGKYNIFKDKIVEKQGFMPCVRAVFERGEKANFTITYNTAELRHLNPQQKVSLVLELTISPVKNENGKVKNAVIQHVDITARKKAEEALASISRQNELILNSAAEGILGVDLQGNHTFVNSAAARMLGYEVEELIGLPSHSTWHHTKPDGSPYPKEECKILTAPLEGKLHRMSTEVFWRKDGISFPVEYSSTPIYEQGRPAGVVVTFTDITERKLAESYREMSNEILQIISKPVSLYDLIQSVITAFKKWTGFDAVGIRLRNGYDFPYFAQNGFSNEFLLTENTLTERGTDGGVCRDKDGNIRLECTCGLVITGRTDPANPLFTKGGSAWTNDSFPLLDLPSDQDPRLNPRNQCIHQSYASVALVPIRTKDQIVGLIQFNDRRKNCFSLAAIEQFEDIAANIGEALLRKDTEEALLESEERYHFIADHTADHIWTMDLSLRYMYSSPAVTRILGYTVDELMAQSVDRFFTPESLVAAKKVLMGELETDKNPNTDPNRIRTFRSEHRHKNGNLVWLESSISIIRDASLKPIGILGVSRDITERKKAEEQLQHLATHDYLTDLPSLKVARDRMSVAFNMARRYKKSTAVMFIDLDGFKDVNDTLGHDAGDYVLKQVAQRLLSCVRETDTVARFGGDEFLIIATEINAPENAAQIAEKVIQLVSQPVIFKKQQAVVGASIGIALFPDHGKDMDQLIKLADEAMYRVKNAGKNGFVFVNS